MFDEARNDLADALAQSNQALTMEEAKTAISGGNLLAEQAINQYAETEEVDGTTYVVSIEGQDVRFEVAAESTSEDADAVSEDSDAEEDPEPSSDVRAAEDASVDLQQDEEAETYNLNGLRVDVNPDTALVGHPTGEDVYGLRKLTNSHPDVPDTDVPYYPADLGERDTEEVFYRTLALDLPVILEGEAGTGKNQLVSVAGSRTNHPVYRQEFGADTSVYDVVGEKDLHSDGGTYYILGKAAKAAIFGGIYVADEINMASGSVTSYLHPLFEDKGNRELDLRGTGITLRDLPDDVEWDPEKHLGRYLHPDFHAVGTMNPLHYADTQEMNDALRSRCVVIEHPYLAESEDDVLHPTGDFNPECHLLADETGVEPRDANDLVKLAAVLREARREGNAISCPIGHRELRDTIELAGSDEEFMSFKAAAKIKMVGQASLKQDKQYISDTIEDEL